MTIDKPPAHDPYNLLSPAFLADPYSVYARLRTDDPVRFDSSPNSRARSRP